MFLEKAFPKMGEIVDMGVELGIVQKVVAGSVMNG